MPQNQQDAKKLLAASIRITKASKNWQLPSPDHRVSSVVARFLISLDTALVRVLSSQTALDSIAVGDAVKGYTSAKVGSRSNLCTSTRAEFIALTATIYT
ncbi:hypothetical protein G3480_25380 [Thiorhodococcus mannitoliphagus]|uniref:Uncharacterized protein n=1 Tax=Thiorhodococcus mannitoliphagus TaxID=329406 RepID=A0A6P1E1A0_9GAMM|nr:hypothetical protein [Thiorhodococcus mannitoliphagus]NEX23570.1 hypothetical protein [Thiorhodococcus mannitoliphagus]